MSVTLPDSITAIDTMLTFTRVWSARPGDEVVSFLAVWNWLKGRAESPEPLLVDTCYRDADHFDVLIGRLPNGERHTIRVKGINPLYIATDTASR